MQGEPTRYDFWCVALLQGIIFWFYQIMLLWFIQGLTFHELQRHSQVLNLTPVNGETRLMLVAWQGPGQLEITIKLHHLHCTNHWAKRKHTGPCEHSQALLFDHGLKSTTPFSTEFSQRKDTSFMDIARLKTTFHTCFSPCSSHDFAWPQEWFFMVLGCRMLPLPALTEIFGPQSGCGSFPSNTHKPLKKRNNQRPS